jgi:DNA topoisomerase IB
MGLMMKKEGKAPIFDTSQARQRIETGKRAKWFQRKGSKSKNFRYLTEQLGNTPTVCRGSYIHPTIIKSYENGVTLEEFAERKKQ